MGLDRVGRQPERVGDLGDGQFEEVVEREAVALAAGESSERVDERAGDRRRW